MRVFTWLLLMDRLNTKNLLKRKKFKIEGNNYNCILCTSHREKIAMHLFFAASCWEKLRIQWQRGIPFFFKCWRWSNIISTVTSSWKFLPLQPGKSGSTEMESSLRTLQPASTGGGIIWWMNVSIKPIV